MTMVKTVCSDILETIRQIDILVNNAGLALGLAPYQDYEELDMLTMLDTNVKGLMAVTRCFLPSMVAANQGHIINMGSTAGIYAYAGAAVYSATKAAVKTFSDGLRIDTIATDIKVTTIQPGIVETDFSTVRFHGDKERLSGDRSLAGTRHRRHCCLCDQSTPSCADYRYDHYGQSTGDRFHGS